jgi:WhiB family redox-sensing transcriptional regulator
VARSRYGIPRVAGTADLLAGEWRVRAACRGRVCLPEGDVWFAPDGEPTDGPVREVRERAAKRVCARCSVRAECLGFALATGQQHGVWGGLSQAELRARRRKVGRAWSPVLPGTGRHAARLSGVGR